MTSIRTFLIVVIISVVCLTNFIAALQGYRDSLNAVDRIEEQLLREKAQVLKAIFNGRGSLSGDLFASDTLYQVWRGDQLLAKSANAPESLFFAKASGFHFKPYAGSQWLLYGTDEDVHIIVATQHRVYSSLTEDVLIRTILPIIWVLPIIGLLVWFIVAIGLKPLDRLAAQLSARTVNDLSIIKSDRYTRELAPIVAALNGLFNRLDKAFEKERRFSANSAHELRTPLAALKIHLHNLSSEFDHNESLEAVKRTADRMEHSIEQLLALHRASLEENTDGFETIDLHKSVQEVVVDVYDQLALKYQHIELLGESGFIRGDAPSIAILLKNLIDNASKYTPQGGSIRITMAHTETQISLLIEDSGPGVPDSEYSRILDRFYRVGEEKHASEVVGSGLGLSIVADIARVHQAQILISRSTELGGLAVKIIFPVSVIES